MKKIDLRHSLTAQIGIALLLAVIAGVLLRNQSVFVNEYIKPIGVIFLNLLKFIVVPLVLFSIMAGILSMNDIKKVGRLGLRALLYFMVTTLFAVTLGLIVPTLLKGLIPPIQINLDVADVIDVPHRTLMDQIVEMFPRNIIEPMGTMAMMQVIVIALLFGIGGQNIGVYYGVGSYRSFLYANPCRCRQRAIGARVVCGAVGFGISLFCNTCWRCLFHRCGSFGQVFPIEVFQEHAIRHVVCVLE